MPEYVILGKSNSTLAMIFDIIHNIHGLDFSVKIIENIVSEDDLPYRMTGVECKNIFHTDWDHLTDINNHLPLFPGVYRPQVKETVFYWFLDHYGIKTENYTNLIHSSVSIGIEVSLARGIFIAPGSIIAPFAELGNMVSVNRGVTIGHHTTIGDFSTINPGVNIAGRCVIGMGVRIGIGASLVDGITIGENTVIGAGSLVTRDIPPSVVAYGVPAKIIKQL